MTSKGHKGSAPSAPTLLAALLIAALQLGCPDSARRRVGPAAPQDQPRAQTRTRLRVAVSRPPPARPVSHTERLSHLAKVARRRGAWRPPANLTSPLMNLGLRQFHPAVYLWPYRSAQGPQPVIVLLHGKQNGRSEECRIWGRVAQHHGWLLCPAGRPLDVANAVMDRWTWPAEVAPVSREVDEGLQTLGERYPELVDPGDLTMVGFSLGALYAPEVIFHSWSRYRQLVLVEGVSIIGLGFARRLKARGLRRVAYLCGEHTTCSSRARTRLPTWRRAGVQARLFEMKGVGHTYVRPFDPVAQRVLGWVHALPAGHQRAVRSGPAPLAAQQL